MLQKKKILKFKLKIIGKNLNAYYFYYNLKKKKKKKKSIDNNSCG